MNGLTATNIFLTHLQESPLNSTATHQGEHHQCSMPVVTYAPEHNTVHIHTPERESRETDALITPQS